MTLALFSWPLFRAWDANGLPLAGGKLYSYAAGTSTPLSLLAADGTTPLANPVILSASGQAECRLRPASYKLNLFSALDVQQADWPVDNVTFTTTDGLAGLSATVAAMRVQTDPGEVGTESLATTLAGEHERLRYRIAEIAGATYWYETKSGIRAQNLATASLPAAAIAGRLARVSDGIRGLHVDTGSAWIPVGRDMMDIRDFGAVGDGATDNAAAIETALAIAPTGAVVYVPPGTFMVSRNVFCTRSDITLCGAGFCSIIKATSGFTNTQNKGMVCFGFSPSAGVTSISNVVVQDLTMNGNSKAKAVEFLYTTKGTITRVQALNSGLTHPCVFTETTTDLLISHCIVAGAIGEFGDGIYAAGAIRPKILFNTISDFTRLGITTEVDGLATNSKDVLIQGNFIYNAHNSTAAEHNGGIWLENTNGGQIIGNICENLHNSPGAQSTNGITVSIGGASGSQFQVIGNQVSGCQVGLHIQVGPTCNVQVDQFSMKRGTIANYLVGVQIISGFNIHLSGIQLGQNSYASETHSGVLVSSTSGINEISIVDSGVAGPGPMVYTNVSAADLNIRSLGGTLSSLALRNVQNWKIQMLASPDVVNIAQSNLHYDSTTVNFMGAVLTMKVVGTTISESGAGALFLLCNPGATYSFQDVTFIAVEGALTQSSAAGLQYLFLDNCKTYQCQFGFTGYFYVALDGCYWNEYPTTGAIVCNGANNTMHLRVRNTDFNRSTDVAPINVSGFQLATYILMNVVRSSTSIGTLTPGSTGYPVIDILP